MKNNKNPLTFAEYREKYKTPMTVFAARCGLTFFQVYNISRGKCPSLQTAVAIEKYTEGEITCETLLPVEKIEEIEKRKEKHKEKHH